MTWRITDSYYSHSASLFVFVFERGEQWVSVDLQVKWLRERGECHLLSVVPVWIKTDDRQLETEIEQYIREHEDACFDAALAALAEAA